MSCVFLFAALRQLHSVHYCDIEFQEIEQEKNHLSGFKSIKPWELFADRSLRWQLLTVILLSAVQQLNGINAVCILSLNVFNLLILSKKRQILFISFSFYFLDILLHRLCAETVRDFC